jgi:hypothetical protein
MKKNCQGGPNHPHGPNHPLLRYLNFPLFWSDIFVTDYSFGLENLGFLQTLHKFTPQFNEEQKRYSKARAAGHQIKFPGKAFCS